MIKALIIWINLINQIAFWSTSIGAQLEKRDSNKKLIVEDELKNGPNLKNISFDFYVNPNQILIGSDG